MLVMALGLFGFMFGGRPDTANDFSCEAWSSVMKTLSKTKHFKHATVIVGHATRWAK
jgi:hypothetical protein